MPRYRRRASNPRDDRAACEQKEPGAIRIAGIAMLMRSRQASGLHALSLSEKGVKIYEIGQVAAQQCELD